MPDAVDGRGNLGAFRRSRNYNVLRTRIKVRSGLLELGKQPRTLYDRVYSLLFLRQLSGVPFSINGKSSIPNEKCVVSRFDSMVVATIDAIVVEKVGETRRRKQIVDCNDVEFRRIEGYLEHRAADSAESVYGYAFHVSCGWYRRETARVNE